MTIEDKALDFATYLHEVQIRKYTGEPYINHCINVANLVKTAKYCTPEMIAAALLHDTVEDTVCTIDDIQRQFGLVVAAFVDGLTDVSKPSDGNREARKKIDRDHYIRSMPQIQTIKIADLIDNSSSIVEHDPEFAEVYMKEKSLLLEVLIDGDDLLYQQAFSIVNDYYLQEGISK